MNTHVLYILKSHTASQVEDYIYIDVHFSEPQENGGSSTEPVDNKELQGVGSADGLRQIYIYIYLYLYL